VIGRIRIQGTEFFRIFDRSLIRFPSLADREHAEAPHVHHPHLGDGRRRDVGALLQGRADEQSAVRLAVDGEPPRIRPSGRAQILRGGDPT